MSYSIDGLRLCNQNQKVPSSNPTGTRLGLGTQHCSKAPRQLRVKHVKTQWLTSSECGHL